MLAIRGRLLKRHLRDQIFESVASRFAVELPIEAGVVREPGCVAEELLVLAGPSEGGADRVDEVGAEGFRLF